MTRRPDDRDRLLAVLTVGVDPHGYGCPEWAVGLRPHEAELILDDPRVVEAWRALALLLEREYEFAAADAAFKAADPPPEIPPEPRRYVPDDIAGGGWWED